VEVPLFDQVADLLNVLVPDGVGELRSAAHRRGIKVWFGTDAAPREHFEAQFVARRHVDGRDGTVLEVGFHVEHRDPARNDAAIACVEAAAPALRDVLGPDAEVGRFFGADSWRRLSEVWSDVDPDDEDLAFDIASRLVDYIALIAPALPRDSA